MRKNKPSKEKQKISPLRALYLNFGFKTQESFAKASKIAPRQLQRYEDYSWERFQGKALMNMARALNLSVDQLIEKLSEDSDGFIFTHENKSCYTKEYPNGIKYFSFCPHNNQLSYGQLVFPIQTRLAKEDQFKCASLSCYVLRGILQITSGDRDYLVEQGKAWHLDTPRVYELANTDRYQKLKMIIFSFPTVL